MKIDIEGQKFGKLLVKKFIGYNGGAWWRCQCDCGKETDVRANHLRRGLIVSCGCYRIEQITKSLFKDLKGKKFGRLTAIKVANNNKGCYIWQCKCDCGKLVNIPGNKLTFGHTKSCGCLLSNICSKRMKELSKYQKGKNHPRWNPNITDEERNKRYKEFRVSKWRNKVYKRDNYTCQRCKDNQGGNLNAHHIYSWTTHPKLRYIVNNGITLCKECHKNFHHKYGYGNNTKKQLTKYIMSA